MCPQNGSWKVPINKGAHPDENTALAELVLLTDISIRLGYSPDDVAFIHQIANL